MQVRQIFALFILFHFPSPKVNGMDFLNSLNPFRTTPKPVPREYRSLSLVLVEDYVKRAAIVNVTIFEVLNAIKHLPPSTSTDKSSSPSTSDFDTKKGKTTLLRSSTSTDQSSSPSMPDAEFIIEKTEFLFACPAEDSKHENLIKSAITENPLFLLYNYNLKDNIAEVDKNEIAGKQLKDREDKTAKPIEKIENLKGKAKAIEGTHSAHNKIDDNTTRNEAMTSSNISNTTATKQANAQGRENAPLLNDHEMKNANDEKLAPVDYENNYKCIKEAEPSIINYTEMGHNVPPYIVYATGYEVYMGTDRYENIYVVMPEHIKEKITKPYYWFNVLTILFDELKLDTRSVSFNQFYTAIESPTVDIHSHIHDYSFGKEKLYKNVDIKQLYTIENQRNVFSKIFENQSESMVNYFDEEQKYLVEVHLAPLNVFRDDISRKPLLTYGNIAPMWKVVRTNSWLLVEKFVDKLATFLSALHVVTGTYGELTLNSSDPIYLGENGDNKILTVPLAFYKIIEYTHTINESYSMVVVVNNNPYEEIDNVICKRSQCRDYGWQQLEDGKIYCCPLTPEITTLLHIEGRFTDYEVLNLSVYSQDEYFKKIFYGDLEGSTVVNHTVLSTIKMLKEGAKKPKYDNNNNNNNNNNEIENKKNV